MNKPFTLPPPLCSASSELSNELFECILDHNTEILAAEHSDCCKVYFIVVLPTSPNDNEIKLPEDVDSLILYVGKNINHLDRPLKHIKTSVQENDENLFLNPCYDMSKISHYEMIRDLLNLQNNIGIITVPFCNISLSFALESAVIRFLASCYNSNNGRKIPTLLSENFVNTLLDKTMNLVRSRIVNSEFDAICCLHDKLIIDDYTTRL